jgi:nucleotide-binding universal stress UspA family protein
MKILIATDGSKTAEDAARMLARLPHPKAIELTILAVNYTHPVHGSPEVVQWLKDKSEADKVAAHKACQRIEQMFEGANASVKSAVVQGHAGEAIVHEAQRRDVDLVVIGSVGHSAFERLLIGSVSDFVATHAPCSVLVVRPPHPHRPEQPAMNLCVAYDDSESCKKAIQEVCTFDWSHNSRIDVISIMTLPYMYSEIPIEIDTLVIKTAMQKTLEDGATNLRQFSANVHSKLIESNHVGDAIVNFAKQEGSDIIVLGNSGHGLVSRLLLGSASRYVLRHAPCSVWITRG